MTDDSEALAALKTLVAVAWADGKITPDEQELLGALTESAGLSLGEQASLQAFACEPRTLADAPVERLDEAARRDVLERAVMLSLIDGDAHPDEKRIIADLAGRLGLPDTDQLVASATARARRMRELL